MFLPSDRGERAQTLKGLVTRSQIQREPRSTTAGQGSVHHTASQSERQPQALLAGGGSGQLKCSLPTCKRRNEAPATSPRLASVSLHSKTMGIVLKSKIKSSKHTWIFPVGLRLNNFLSGEPSLKGTRKRPLWMAKDSGCWPLTPYTSGSVHTVSESRTVLGSGYLTSCRPQGPASWLAFMPHLPGQTPPPVQQACAESFSMPGPVLHSVVETQNERRPSPALRSLQRGTAVQGSSEEKG